MKSDDFMFPRQILQSELHSESLCSEAVGVQCCGSLLCEEYQVAGTILGHTERCDGNSNSMANGPYQSDGYQLHLFNIPERAIWNFLTVLQASLLIMVENVPPPYI